MLRVAKQLYESIFPHISHFNRSSYNTLLVKKVADSTVVYGNIFPMTLNKILRGTVIASVFSVLIVPFIVGNNLFFPFISGKGFFFRAMVEIGFAAWLLLSMKDAAFRPRKSVLMWSFVAFLAVIGLANIFGESPWKSFWSNFERMEGYVTLIHLFLYFLIAGSVLATEGLWKKFLSLSLVSSFLMCMYSFFQLSGALVINQGGVRVDGKFGNATYLAIFLVFNIFFALILAFKYHREKITRTAAIWLYSGIAFVMLYVWYFIDYNDLFTRSVPNLGRSVFLIYMVLGLAAVFTWLSRKFTAAALYLSIVPVLVFVLYFTATRGAILGLIGGLFLSAVIIALFNKNDRKTRIISASAVGAIILVILVFIGMKDTTFVQQSPVLSRFASISWNDTKTQARAYVWPMAIEGWKERPILGWGQENFNYVFNKNYDPRMYSQEQWFDHAHNIVLDWLVAGGILGLLAYLSLFVTAIYLLWKKAIGLEFTEKALITGLGAAYVFHNLFVFDNIVSYILFVSVLAYIHYSSTKLMQPVASDADELDDSDTRVAGPIILVALVFSLYFFVWRGYATGTSLIDALRAVSGNPVNAELALTSFNKALSYDTLGRSEVTERMVESIRPMNGDGISLETRQKFFEATKIAVDRQLERYSNDARYYVFAGGFYGSYSQTDLAIEKLTKAVELSPKKQSILSQLGSAYVVSGQYEKALEIFKRTYDLEPSYAQARQMYGASLIYVGREAEARELLGDAAEDAFLSAYAEMKKWSSVIPILKSRIARDPGNSQNRMNLVAAYFQSGDKASAVATLQEMIRLDPSFKETGEQYIKEIQAQ